MWEKEVESLPLFSNGIAKNGIVVATMSGAGSGSDSWYIALTDAAGEIEKVMEIPKISNYILQRPTLISQNSMVMFSMTEDNTFICQVEF